MLSLSLILSSLSLTLSSLSFTLSLLSLAHSLLSLANPHSKSHRPTLPVAEVLVGLAMDTTVYLSRRGGVFKVHKLTFTLRASDSGGCGDFGFGFKIQGYG